MARTSGAYTPPNGSWSSGAVNGALATVADWQTLLNDLSSALTQSVSKDGQTTLTGNLNMGGNTLTNLSAGAVTGQAVRWEQLFSQGTEADLASAATTDIGLQNTNFLRVTGTTTITSFGTNYNGPRFIRFAAALTLTNSATLILPGASDITTVAGDTLIAIPKATSGTADGWQVVAYQKNALPGTPGTGTVTNSVLADGAVYGTKLTDKIQPILATVASNALTITLNPTTLDFRSTTLPNGAVSTVTLGSATTLVVPTLATLGTISAQQSRLVVLAINNAGTMEAAVVNIAGGKDLSETGLISTTAISGSATANNVVYSTTARTSVAYRVVGYVESTQATAGTWATAPSTVQGQGGLIVPGSLIKSGTAVASTSGISIDFTSIPSWVKRITVMLSGVSTNGSSTIRLQLGDAGGIETTGYAGTCTQIGSTVSTIYSTSGFDSTSDTSALHTRNGQFVFALLGSNTWSLIGAYNVSSAFQYLFCGTKTLSDTLTQVRIATVNGTDTFDAGTINLLWE